MGVPLRARVEIAGPDAVAMEGAPHGEGRDEEILPAVLETDEPVAEARALQPSDLRASGHGFRCGVMVSRAGA